jgi:nucleoside-diphosphate-sugar epimerase
MSSANDAKERYLVLGGAGFLGSYVVQALLQRGETCVAVFDLKEPADSDKDVQVAYYTGDLCDLKCITNVLQMVSPNFTFRRTGRLMIHWLYVEQSHHSLPYHSTLARSTRCYPVPGQC